MKSLLITLLFLFLGSSFASAGLLKDFDSLGGNDVLMERAKDLAPEKRVGVVQNRIVDRRWRHELSVGYGNYLGGDTFLESQTLDFSYNLHINPYVAVGVGYFTIFNNFSKEGRHLIDEDRLIPDVDAPREGYEFVIHGYPMYGKINLFNAAVLHFDLYGLASYGKMNLFSGDTEQYSFGLGAGFWISKYITSRIEIRERFFKSKRIQGDVDMDMTVASFSIGLLL